MKLPEWLLHAIRETNNDYNPGERTDYSSTTLIKPPMILHLERAHADQLSDEPTGADLSSFFGTAIHNQLENKLQPLNEFIVEERLYAKIGGFVISCQIDLYEKSTKTLSDHKTTSIYKVQKAEHDEWEQQLNINRWIMQENGYEVDHLKINAFPLDWRRSEGLRDSSYPPHKYKEVQIPLWTKKDAEEFILGRIKLHENAKAGFPQPCTPEDRWARADSWALIKSGGKRAKRVFWDHGEAEMALASENDDYTLEYRPGEDIRCKEYCPVNVFCDFYKTKYGEQK